jgi:hypothetical protein
MVDFGGRAGGRAIHVVIAAAIGTSGCGGCPVLVVILTVLSIIQVAIQVRERLWIIVNKLV